MATNYVCLDEKNHETDRFWDNTREPREKLQPIDGYENIPLVLLEEAIESIVCYCPNIDQHVKSAISKCRKPADGLTQNESAAIYLYTMQWNPREECLYYVLNKRLRNQNRKKLQPWFLYLKLLLTALQKLPSHNEIIWRGVTLDLGEQYQIGEHLFLGIHGPRTLFNIQCQSGKIIRSHSYFSNEDEILLLPATQFEVKSKLKPSNDLHIIHLKEVDPSGIQLKENNEQQMNHYRNDKLEQLISQCPTNGIVNLNEQKFNDNDISIVVQRLINDRKCLVLQMCLNMITDQGAQHLGKALQSNISLTQLNLRGNQISDAGARWIAQTLCINTNLTCLNLVNNQIHDEGTKFLARTLFINKTLTRLYLANNRVGLNGIQSFAKALIHNRTLLILDLSSNEITDDQLIYLATMLRENQTLRILGLADNRLTDHGIKFLMHAVRNNRRVEGLNIACSQLTNKCIKDIHKMFKRNETLVELWLLERSFSTLGQLKFWALNKLMNNRRIRFVENRHHNQNGSSDAS